MTYAPRLETREVFGGDGTAGAPVYDGRGEKWLLRSRPDLVEMLNWGNGDVGVLRLGVSTYRFNGHG